MKILVVCQHYYPEPFRLPDICEALAKRGHEVTVVTGTPNYPMGEIYEGYRHGERREEILNGVRVHRCRLIPRKTGVLFRVLNYYSFQLSSTHFVRRLAPDHDVVFVNQLSPVMMARAGIRYAGKNHKKLVLYCLDQWPASLQAGGIGESSPVFGLYHRVSERIYKSADKLLLSSRSFADYFKKEFGIEETEYLPQYAETMFTPEICQKKPDGRTDLMFAGNIGKAQSVDTVIKAARLTRSVPGLRWHIVGDGSEYENVKKQAEGLDNVIFYGRRPLEEMPELYAAADAMLVTLTSDPVISMTLPGKVQTYMAAGKPILAAANGEIPLVIREAGCGACVPAGDAEALAEAAAAFADNREKETLGHRAAAYYEAHFTRDRFLARLEQVLKEQAR